MARRHPIKTSTSALRRNSFLAGGDERGVALITVAVFLVVLFGLAALVVDLGLLLTARSELQNAADSGALAGLVDHVTKGTDRGIQTAKTYATDLNNFHIVSPAPGLDAVGVTILGPETMEVRVRRTAGTSAGAMPTIFANIWGIKRADVSAVAVATMNRRILGSGPGNILPFGVKKEMVDTNGDNLYDLGNIVDIFPHPWAVGNFALLDLNGGENSESDIVRWIEHGYDEYFILPEGAGDLEVEGSPHMNIEGKPGVVGTSFAEALYTRVGDIVLLPVFNKVWGTGANTRYQIIDLIGVKVLNAQLTQSVGNRYLNIEISQFAATNLVIGGEGTPNNNTISTPILIR